MNVKISVRSLVEFIFRNGDISDGHSGTLSKEAMNAGSRIHRKLQKKAGSYYNAEVPLKFTVEQGAHSVLIEGRADGIIDKKHPEAEDEYITIDEIKGVYRKLADIEEPEQVHLAQAMCYAYIYSQKEELSEIQVQITYVNLESEEVKQFIELYTFQELHEWFYAMIDQLLQWIDYAVTHSLERNDSIEALEFPFAYRKGQKEMAACVYKAIGQGQHLFVQAPTGIGKTMAALYPTIKSFTAGETSKVFYLTAKTIAHTVAENAISLLREKGLVFSSVIITAKEKLCPNDEMECNPDICPYAKGHYDRINEALYDLITHETDIQRETILSYANKHMVCPFELNLDASLFADAIICDYNYVFDPRVNLKRFFAKESSAENEYVFLVDEAHNLVDRASSMYSATLIKEDFLQIKKIVKKYSSRTAGYIEKCNKELLEMKRACMDEQYQVLSSIGDLHFKLLNLYSGLETFLEEYKHIPERKDVLEFYFKLNTFLNIAELLDDSYVIYDEILPDGSFMLKLYCVHPATNLRQCLSKGIATVFFSATILPVTYYKEMLSDSPEDCAIYIPSPFDKSKRCILIGNDVTTRYTKRSISEYKRIYEYIKQVADAKKGNYMVFFPSYRMMQDIYELALEEAEQAEGKWQLMIQGSGMKESEREDFLKQFETQDNVLAFCIMGGIFSEGIDLDREKLSGAIVVGPGLPQVCNERKILMDYFNQRSSKEGFHYAYLYPGINKVFQAAGRVIRTEEDTGVILLLDERFATYEYARLFPVEWQDAVCCNRKNVGGLLRDFWETVE